VEKVRRLLPDYGKDLFIRGEKKMKCRVGLAMIVMLATAVSWIEAGQVERARCCESPDAGGPPRRVEPKNSPAN